METIKRAWNWRPDPATAKSAKLRALKAMAYFLLLMLCCTLVSRAADSVTVPVVTVTTAKRMSLTHTFSSQGTLEARGGVPVITTSGLPVLELAVANGDRVQAGDLLFTCDTQEIQREISQLNLDIQAAQTELRIMEEQSGQAAEQDERTRRQATQRAEEDYEAAARKADFAVQEASNSLYDARLALDKYRGIGRSDYDDSEYTREEHDRLRSAYRAAQTAYDEAVANREDILRDAQRIIEDASVQPENLSDSGADLKRLSLQKLYLQLSALQESIASGGQVFSPADGIVSGLTLDPGSRTGSEAVALIQSDESLRFTARISEEERKLVQPGDFFALTLSGSNKANRDMQILAITQDAQNPAEYIVTAEPPDGTGLPGQTGTAEFTRRTETYNSTLPLSALWGSDNNYYVLAVQETQSTLGTEYMAARQPVEVLERNGEAVAVSGLAGEQLVVAESDKPVREGSRIRLQ